MCLYCAATVAAVDLLLTQLVNCPVELNGHCETCVSVIHMHCSHYCDFASVEVVIKNYLLTYSCANIDMTLTVACVALHNPFY